MSAPLWILLQPVPPYATERVEEETKLVPSYERGAPVVYEVLLVPPPPIPRVPESVGVKVIPLVDTLIV